ncbi:molybdenum cofactor guanylyltransferase [Halobaculum sp. D14]|uniref:molybdenum cofactor guanylyltransferase n=1 Tax=Halobaculum sp. D14 TaxID=3421642 RepID=UPI003EBB0294
MRGPAVRGVVLAGGDSTRFGAADKALAEVDGAAMIRRVADAVGDATGSTPLVAAGDDPGPAYRAALPDAGFVSDHAAFVGPLAGVAGAAREADATWLVVAACDMPRVDARTVRWLVDRCEGGEPGADADAAADTHAAANADADAVVPVDADGVAQPLFACYRRDSLVRALEEVPRTAGPRALLDSLAAAVVTPADAPDGVSLDAALANVNTAADLDGLDSSGCQHSGGDDSDDDGER